jgi:ubiquitin-conjugating enzyme E2 J1
LVALRSFMETDAKGQVGGMDTSEAVRRRLARESGGWKCAVCGGGKTNREIMAEQEEAVKKADEERVAKGEERDQGAVEVPKELKMGFRDEMEKAKADTEGAASGSKPAGEIDEESAQLAEGFVRTTNLLPVDLPNDPAASPLEQSQPQYPPPPGSLQPTRTIPLPQPPQDIVGAAYQNQAQLRQGVVNDGVTMWIDRLILIIGALLAAMLAKVMLGS